MINKTRKKVISELEEELGSIKETIQRKKDDNDFDSAKIWHHFKEGIERSIWLVNFHGKEEDINDG